MLHIPINLGITFKLKEKFWISWLNFPKEGIFSTKQTKWASHLNNAKGTKIHLKQKILNFYLKKDFPSLKKKMWASSLNSAYSN